MDLYQEANIIRTEEHLSLLGNRLVIKTYNTSKVTNSNSWEYTEGVIYNTNGDLVGSIKRNYHRFPFVFFNNGTTEYLISGRSYMRQTILNCTTGQIYDNCDDPDADDFCWASIAQLDLNTIIVHGCYWGGGYDYRFFDLSDIEKGWPELKIDELVVKKGYEHDIYCSDYKIDRETGIVTITHLNDYDDSDGDDNEDKVKIEPLIIIKLKRENNLIMMTDLVLSEEQKQRELADDVRQAKEDLETAEIRNSNIFYQHLILRIIELNLRTIDRVILHKKSFSISVSYKKSKTCILEFANNTEIEFKFYDWKNRNNHLSLKFEQNFAVIDEIVSKMKELLVN